METRGTTFALSPPEQRSVEVDWGQLLQAFWPERWTAAAIAARPASAHHESVNGLRSEAHTYALAKDLE